MTSSVLVERQGPVALVTINRPEVRNALDQATLRALHEAIRAADASSEIRAIVLTGAGDRAFCAGMDLRAFARDGPPDEATRPVNLLRDGALSTPTIAAVRGAAIGGGFELALACDLRVASGTAIFALPETGYGLVASEGGTDLARHLPLALALEIALTGKSLSAQAALNHGLVNEIVSGDEVISTAIEVGMRIAARSPAAVAETKRLMYLSLNATQHHRRVANHEATERLLAGPDAAEGAAAFMEKRAPRWADPA